MCVFILPGVLPALCLAGILPTGQMEYEFIYDRLERVDVLSLDNYDYQLGPYQLQNGDFSFAPFESLGDYPPGRIGLFSFLGEDFLASRENRARGFESFRGGIVGQPLNKLFVYASFLLDEEKAKDDDYTGKKWRGLAGYVQDAFVYYQSGRLELTVGRFGSFWGPRNSLVLSGSQRMDGFGYTFHWGKLTLSYRLARLDGLNPDTDSVAQYENRYFAGHRADFRMNEHLRFGLFETVVFGGPGRQIDLFYLNPLIFFHGSQLNEGTNDNTVVGVDFSVKPSRGYKFYGQFLVDDIQVDSDTQGDEEPAEVAFLLGGYVADLVKRLDVKVEYSRVTNWTFNQVLPRNRYTFDNKPIGQVLGNDYDLVALSVIRWMGENTAAALQFSHCRQGEGRVDAEGTEPWTLVDGDYSEPFPTGTPQKTTRASVGVKSFLGGLAFVDVEAGVDLVKNRHHIEGDNRTLPFINIRFSSFVLTSLRLE